MSRFFEHILKKGKNFGNFYFDWACEYIGWQMNRKGCVVQFCIFAMITIRLRDQDTFSALLRNTNSCKQKMPHQGPSINKWQAPFPWNFRQWYCLQTWKFCKQTAETVISSVLPIKITLMKLSNTISFPTYTKFISYLYNFHFFFWQPFSFWQCQWNQFHRQRSLSLSVIVDVMKSWFPYPLKFLEL